MAAAIRPITAIITAGIHSGAQTHHHDHPATTPISANFKIKNTMNNKMHSNDEFFILIDF
jgi:hypothetical protein